MNVQLKLNLPYNGWDYLPLPNVASNVEATPNDSYELVVKLEIPWLPRFVTLINNYLGLNVHLTPEQSNNDIDIGTNFSDDVVAYSSSSTSLVALPPSAEELFVSECREWIEAGQFALCEEGVGGTYFIKNSSGATVAVFKPNDEEPGAPDNPKGLVQDPLLPPGHGYLREIAAYLLDRQFAGVPETMVLSSVKHDFFCTNTEKIGSLQRFIKNDGVSSDLSSSTFPVDAVHRLGILDLRIFNMDRNGENILLRRKPTNNNDNNNNNGSNVSNSNNENKTNNNRVDASYDLVPIDHTYSLPPITSLDSAYFEWHYWPQAKKPFSPSSLSFIRSIDVDEDSQILRSLGLPEPCILTMIVSTLLLQEAASAGWTLFELANFVSRSLATQKERSALEELVAGSLEDVVGGGCGGNNGEKDVKGFLVAYRARLRNIVFKNSL